jgi:hypothetical protein
MNRTQGGDTIALSAFMLSALPAGQARKALVKEMWESGAGVMVSLFYLFFPCFISSLFALVDMKAKWNY